MKAKQYRLGNLVVSKLNGIAKVVQIGSSINPNYIGVKSLKNDFFENTCQPIRLTTDWLIKFGFTNEAVHIGLIEIDDYFLQIEAFVICSQINSEANLEYIYLNGLRQKIKYVHQLQNLYFVLKGEELPHENLI